MSTLNRFVITLAFSVAAWPLLAQTGILFVPFSYDAYTKRGTNSMSIGLCHDVNEHASIAFDVQLGFRLFDKETLGYLQSTYQEQSIDYAINPSFVGFQYRSSYHFRETDEASPYLSVTVGVRSAKLVVSDIYVYNDYGSDDPPSWARPSTEKQMMFPVGLRFGYRSPLDGFVGDIFFGVAKQFGTEPWSAPFILPEDQLAGVSFQVGYAFGGGW